MANLTAKEKALKIVAKQIKNLDDNYIALIELPFPWTLKTVRENWFSIITKSGYDLEMGTYKLIKKK